MPKRKEIDKTKIVKVSVNIPQWLIAKAVNKRKVSLDAWNITTTDAIVTALKAYIGESDE